MDKDIIVQLNSTENRSTTRYDQKNHLHNTVAVMYQESSDSDLRKHSFILTS